MCAYPAALPLIPPFPSLSRFLPNTFNPPAHPSAPLPTPTPPFVYHNLWRIHPSSLPLPLPPSRGLWRDILSLTHHARPAPMMPVRSDRSATMSVMWLGEEGSVGWTWGKRGKGQIPAVDVLSLAGQGNLEREAFSCLLIVGRACFGARCISPPLRHRHTRTHTQSRRDASNSLLIFSKYRCCVTVLPTFRRRPAVLSHRRAELPDGGATTRGMAAKTLCELHRSHFAQGGNRETWPT